MTMRKLLRLQKREQKQANYHSNGLNGPRAVARRKRQFQKQAAA